MSIHVTESGGTGRVFSKFGNVNLLLKVQLRVHEVVDNVGFSFETHADVTSFGYQERLAGREALEGHQ